MQVFEFHFNPRERRDRLFDSFCFEPADYREKAMGNLYILGELKNVLPKNSKFLTKLAKFLKEEYYLKPQKSSIGALQQTLAAGNEFLANLKKSGNVSWLGNLNFIILSIVSITRSQWKISFATVGGLKLFLLRKDGVVDISEPASKRAQRLQRDPLKVFGGIITGELTKNDKVLATTPELTKHLLQAKSPSDPNNIINRLSLAEPKEIKRIFQEKKKELLRVSGASLLIVLKEKAQAFRPAPAKISRISSKAKQGFKVKLLAAKKFKTLPAIIKEEVKNSFLAPFRKIKAKITGFKSSILQKLKGIPLPKRRIPKIQPKIAKAPAAPKKPRAVKVFTLGSVRKILTHKITVLIFSLAILLLLGFLLFKK